MSLLLLPTLFAPLPWSEKLTRKVALRCLADVLQPGNSTTKNWTGLSVEIPTIYPDYRCALRTQVTQATWTDLRSRASDEHSCQRSAY